VITLAIAAVKEALLGLKDQAGAAIFADPANIYTGYPHPDLIKPTLPEVNRPLVCVYFKGDSARGIGYHELLSRDDDAVGAEEHRRDTYAVGELNVSCDIYVMAATALELTGGETWVGYVEQILLLVRAHAVIVGPENTAILWDIRSFDMPGMVSVEAQDRRLFLALIRTALEGKLVPAAPVDGAQIDELYPHDGDYAPVGP
jgi:hypothetical protein